MEIRAVITRICSFVATTKELPHVTASSIPKKSTTEKKPFEHHVLRRCRTRIDYQRLFRRQEVP